MSTLGLRLFRQYTPRLVWSKYADSRLPAAVGSTIYSDPLVQQAVKRVKAGKLGVGEFAKMYSGQIRNKILEGIEKHRFVHGLGRTDVLTPDKYVITLSR